MLLTLMDRSGHKRFHRCREAVVHLLSNGFRTTFDTPRLPQTVPRNSIYSETLMRPLLVVLTIVMAFATTAAQTPRLISFQGVLTDPSGVLVPDGTHTLRLRLFDALTGGTELFAETQDVVVVRGVFK